MRTIAKKMTSDAWKQSDVDEFLRQPSLIALIAKDSTRIYDRVPKGAANLSLRRDMRKNMEDIANPLLSEQERVPLRKKQYQHEGKMLRMLLEVEMFVFQTFRISLLELLRCIPTSSSSLRRQLHSVLVDPKTPSVHELNALWAQWRVVEAKTISVNLMQMIRLSVGLSQKAAFSLRKVVDNSPTSIFPNMNDLANNQAFWKRYLQLALQILTEKPETDPNYQRDSTFAYVSFKLALGPFLHSSLVCFVKCLNEKAPSHGF